MHHNPQKIPTKAQAPWVRLSMLHVVSQKHHFSLQDLNVLVAIHLYTLDVRTDWRLLFARPMSEFSAMMKTFCLKVIHSLKQLSSSLTCKRPHLTIRSRGI